MRVLWCRLDSVCAHMNARLSTRLGLMHPFDLEGIGDCCPPDHAGPAAVALPSTRPGPGRQNLTTVWWTETSTAGLSSRSTLRSRVSARGAQRCSCGGACQQVAACRATLQEIGKHLAGHLS